MRAATANTTGGLTCIRGVKWHITARGGEWCARIWPRWQVAHSAGHRATTTSVPGHTHPSVENDECVLDRQWWHLLPLTLVFFSGRSENDSGNLIPVHVAKQPRSKSQTHRKQALTHTGYVFFCFPGVFCAVTHPCSRANSRALINRGVASAVGTAMACTGCSRVTDAGNGSRHSLKHDSLTLTASYPYHTTTARTGGNEAVPSALFGAVTANQLEDNQPLKKWDMAMEITYCGRCVPRRNVKLLRWSHLRIELLFASLNRVPTSSPRAP